MTVLQSEMGSEYPRNFDIQVNQMKSIKLSYKQMTRQFKTLIFLPFGLCGHFRRFT